MEKDSNGQSVYRAKTRTVQELQYLNNFQLLSEQIIQWGKSKPDNGIFKVLGQSLGEIGVYVAVMQMEADSFEKIVSQYRADKLKYQREALDSAQKLANYEQKHFDGK